MLPQSAPYQRVMHRLAVIIAIVFGFAALGGATTAHAHRYVSTPIVVLNHVDAQNQAIPVVVQIQRGQIDLGAGIVMPCGSHNAIGVTVARLPMAPDSAAPEPALQPVLSPHPGTRLLRPPITA